MTDVQDVSFSSPQLLHLLFEIPTDVLRHIILPYASISEISCLDIAITSYSLRPVWLDALDGLKLCHTTDIETEVTMSKLLWLNSRGLVLDVINLQGSTCIKDNDRMLLLITESSKLSRVKQLSCGLCCLGRENISLCTRLPHLESVNLSGQCLEVVAQFLQQSHPNLHTLNISRVYNIGIKDTESITNSFPALKSLSICGNRKLADDSLASLARGCPQLSHLDVSNCRGLKGPGLIEIALRCQSLTSLDLSMCTISASHLTNLFNCTLALERLLLRNCFGVSDEVVETLVKTSRRLVYLDLSGCSNITNASLTAVLSHCPCLTHLGINDCFRVRTKAFTSIISSLNLESIQLDNCDKITDQAVVAIIEKCPALRCLSVGFCLGVSNVSLIALSARSIYIVKLNLEACYNVSDEGLEALVSIGGGSSPLEEISLASVYNISDRGICAIAENCSSLRVLNISVDEGSRPGITDKSIVAIAQRCGKLCDLNLNRCRGITDVSVEAVAASCPFLEKIRMRYCALLTDAAISALAMARCWKQLRYIDVGHCQQLTDSSIAKISKKFVNIEKDRNACHLFFDDT